MAETCAPASALGQPLEERAAGHGQSTRTPLWTLKATQMLGSAAFACFARYITVYYHKIGLSRSLIGVLSLISPFASFGGQLFWGALIDRLGDYKRTLVLTQMAGTLVIFLYMVPAVQESFAAIFVVTTLWCFLLSTGGPIIDAMCLTVLAEGGTDEAYGDQRLWCAIGWGGMALFAGQLIDDFGLAFMFIGFGIIQTANIVICVFWLPTPKGRNTEAARSTSESEVARPSLCSFEVMWFFTNLIIYGIGMSLIESFLFVYLLQDFENTPNVLLGAATAVMCAFEVPVFKYVGRLWKNRDSSLTSVLLGSQAVLVLRCWLYTVLPRSQPWLVLVVEPLHGICFAAMWAATVEYGQRLAPKDGMAKMQALVNGIYYNVAMGVGSLFWGMAVEEKALGFEHSFLLDALIVVVWSFIWQAGLCFDARRKQRSARTLAEESANARLAQHRV